MEYVIIVKNEVMKEVIYMGMYLNSKAPYTLYQSECANPYFVDKTALLQELFPYIDQGKKCLCITRPRRFGKTVMANMISAYLGKGKDAKELFDKLYISQSDYYTAHLNKYNVISISFNELPRNCKSYESYIDRIQNRLIRDLIEIYPSCKVHENEALWDILQYIYETEEAKFIFVLDEWDFIFHRDFVSAEDKKDFISFLSMLLKDKAYVLLAYMTGILPIAKYSSGSELNMFVEYSMASQAKFGDYFGFTDDEVDVLYQKYLDSTNKPTISREGLRIWYDGYHTLAGERMYNPRSVVTALSNNQLSNYWTSSGPYDEIFYYIKKNVDVVREDLALMVAGEVVPAQVQEYAATSMNLQTRDEIFSAMVVYGFLNYENGKVAIPNKELMDKFADMLQKESSLGYIYQLAHESDRMLRATLAGDTKTMAEILAYAHNTETPLLSYNHETELSAIVNMVYLSARNTYDIQREDKAGTGYVDFIFYPKNRSKEDCLILELKVDSTPDEAIQQIKERNYILRFTGKLGEDTGYTGRILAVGIGYDKKTKIHSCKIDILREHL